MVFSAVFAGFATPVFADGHTDEYRIAGENRYLTAYEIAKYNDVNPETVIIVRGDGPSDAPNVVDGLTASGLAGAEGAQILLVQQDRIPNGTLAALDSLNPENAIIVGGEAAVSENVASELVALGLNVSRVSGDNRADTAAEVAKEMGQATGNIGIIVDGFAEVDSLVAGPLALQGHPILMVNNGQGRIPESTKDAIEELGIESLLIVGGTNVVSEALEAELDGLEGVSVLDRFAGTNRVETSLMLAEFAAFDSFDSVSFVNGWNYVDAVAASTLGQPVVYLDLRQDRDWSSSQNAGALALLETLQGFKAIGGPAVIPNAIVEAAINVISEPADEVSIKILSAKARTNTEVTVELEEAPLRNLMPSDFNISPALEIESVTTNNNIITLKTASQTEGTVYTITPAQGSGSATFTGLPADLTTGNIENVEVLNLRQVRVDFIEPVRWSSVDGLSNEHYFDMVMEEDGDITTHRLDSLLCGKMNQNSANDISNGNCPWFISDDGQVTATNTMVDYVILESSYADVWLTTQWGPFDGQVPSLDYNQTVNFNTRNAQDADGNYFHTSEGAFTVKDNTPPEVDFVTTTAVSNEQTGAEAELEIRFSEPVLPRTENTGFKFYINGVNVDNLDGADITSEPVGFGAYSVAHESTVVINVEDLPRGEHTLEIVGAKDLNDNVQNINPYTRTFVIEDREPVAPGTPERPNVVDIQQAGDNVLEIYFDQLAIVPYDGSDEHIILHDSVWDESEEEWVDLVIDVTGARVLEKEWLYEGSFARKLVVAFDATNDADENATLEQFNYDSQNLVIRDVTVKNYSPEGYSDELFYRGPAVRETIQFKKDQTSPVYRSMGYNVSAGQLSVRFSDGPFAVGAPIALQEDRDITISRTDSDGQTYEIVVSTDDYLSGISYASNLYDWNQFSVRDTLVFDLSALGGTELLTSAGELYRESVYTVTFDQGAVVDVQSEVEANGNFIPEFEFYTGEEFGDFSDVDVLLLDGPNESAAFAGQVRVPAEAPPAPPAPGIVPATTRGLIQSGVDIADPSVLTTAITETGSVSQPGTIAYMADDANLNKILVVFDGEVLESSALNKNNYTFNGQPLPQDASIAYYEANTNNRVSIDGATNDTNGFVLITLPEGSVRRDGTYTVSVENITNEQGKRMLPVRTSVQLVDNTKPTMTNVRAIGDKQVEVSFDEPIQLIGSEQQAAGNFTVKVDGQSISVVRVTEIADETRLVLHLADVFNVNGTIEVEAHATANNNFYVFDQAEPPNALRSMTLESN